MSSLTKSPCVHQVRNLLDHTRSELDELFLVLPAPQTGEISGIYRGSLMAIIGLGWLPRFLRIWLYRLLQTFINPWIGKYFDQNEGANIWLSSKGKYPFGYYTIADNQTGNDTSPLTYLSYDVDKNPSFLKPIRGEVRQLHNNLYLARMNYVTHKRTVRVLYFTLEKQAD